MLEKLKIENFSETHSPRKAFLILVFAILISEIFLKYFFIHFGALSQFNTPMINALVLVIILLPILYFCVYRPMAVYYRKLEKSELVQRELSLLDTLTGLYNRRGFILHAIHLLKLSSRSKKEALLIYADLDRLKWINDYLGHEEGDKAIICVAKVLESAFRGSDVVGRIGGDEFAVLAFESNGENIDILRSRVEQKLKEAENEFNPSHTLTLSMGIIYFNPREPQSIESLLKQADALMYDVKRARQQAIKKVKSEVNNRAWAHF